MSCDPSKDLILGCLVGWYLKELDEDDEASIGCCTRVELYPVWVLTNDITLFAKFVMAQFRSRTGDSGRWASGNSFDSGAHKLMVKDLMAAWHPAHHLRICVCIIFVL